MGSLRWTQQRPEDRVYAAPGSSRRAEVRDEASEAWSLQQSQCYRPVIAPLRPLVVSLWTDWTRPLLGVRQHQASAVWTWQCYQQSYCEIGKPNYDHFDVSDMTMYEASRNCLMLKLLENKCWTIIRWPYTMYNANILLALLIQINPLHSDNWTPPPLHPAH